MTYIDYGIVLGYIIFALFVGLYFSKKASESTENYFLGGRTLPWWMIGISMVATSFASDTPLAITEQVRQFGLQKLWWVMISVMPLIVGIFLFSRLWRRASITTDAEFYELRYEGRSAAFLRGYRALFAGVFQNILTIAWVTYGMSSVITVMTGLDATVAISICIVVALVYATFSGFYGVVVTDFLQFFLAVGSMITLAIIAVIEMGGMEQVLNTVVAQSELGGKTLSIFPDFRSFNEDTIKFLIFILVFWWVDANGYNMQRMSACRNEKDAVKATIFYALFQTCRPWMWVVVALVSLALFPTIPEPYSDSHAYAMVMDKYLGVGLKGLLVTAFLAAFMSTIDTHLNWGSSYLVIDVYKRFINKDASQKHYVKFAKVMMVLLMLIGAAVVPLLKSVSGAWEFLAVLVVGSGIISVLRWFWWRINAYTEIAVISFGIVVGTANPFIPDSVVIFGYPWTQMPIEIKIALLTAIVLPLSLGVTFLTPVVSKEKLEHFYRKVRPGGFWSVLDKKVLELPGKALGVGIIVDVFGAILMCYGVSLAIGYAILLQFFNVAVCLILAAIGVVIVFLWFKREVRLLESYRESDADNGVVGEFITTGLS